MLLKKKIFLSSIIAAGLIACAAVSSMADTFNVGITSNVQTGCLTLSNNLHVASRDYFTNGEVTRLQQFLYNRGHLSVSPTGYFGLMTMAAVRNFQATQGIITTGYVGPLTRAAITRVSCGTLPPSTSVIISSLSPSSGPVGTTVTIYGTGFFGNNKIFFDGSLVTAQNSSNGTSLTFTIPSYVSPYCPPANPCPLYAKQVTPGTYNVQVRNSNGESNVVPFTVTGTQQASLSISSLSPSIGTVGTTVTISGSGFTGSNVVYFGGSSIGTVTTQNNNTLTFTVPEYVSPYCAPGMYCAAYMRQITPGTYDVRVQNTNGTSNSLTFTVTSVPQQNVPIITSLSPSSGTIGTTVTVYGSGFFGNNTVYFGGSAVNTVVASNGQMLSFTVPEYISPCNPGMYCTLMARQVTPGVYDVKVYNNNGTSNTVQFTVSGQTSGGAVRIIGLDAPSRLSVWQQGSFTVRTDNTGGNLNYSVRWGDEGIYAAQSTSQPASFQSSATFSHVYSSPGTYYPTFTVTSGGSTATVSASVVVSY